MGKKKYFCDFCNRYFNDDKNTRYKHLKSATHLNMKKKHYSMFRDPETILQEESSKKMCKKFHYEGFCPFDSSCTFSHYSREDLDVIKREIFVKQQQSNNQTVEFWLQKYVQKVEMKNQQSRKLLWSCELSPKLLMNSALLPPSMLPFHIKEFIDADLEFWG